MVFSSKAYKYMEEPQSWRKFLGVIVEDMQERLRIARAIGVNPITLVRWVTGVSSPRLRILRNLLDVLSPEQNEELTQLLLLEYPTLMQQDAVVEEEESMIPATFYAKALETYTNNPIFLRTSVISVIILQQMLEQLDPQQVGLAILIAQCVPPSADTVRSVRIILAQGSGPWKSIEHCTQFCGIESQIGHAVQEQRPIITQSRKERENWYPAHLHSERSAVAAPIRLSDRVAGGVGLLSVREQYFSPEKINLVLAYAELLVLAFEHYDFYAANQIELGVMPPFKRQKPHLEQFQLRVRNYIVQAVRKQELLTRSHAEMVVWQEMEEYILHLAQ